MTTSQPEYQSYLLRIWVEDPRSQSPWRIALVDPHTGERWGFTGLGQMAAFLRDRMRAVMDTPSEGESPSSSSS